MLLRFEVGNFRSIRDRVVLDLRASADSSHSETNLFQHEGQERLLRTVALYGANGSGKSNVLRALDFVTDFAYFSAIASQQDSPIDVEPFRLCERTESQPSFFELEAVAGGVRYRYGLEVSAQAVHSEWLFEARTSREAKLFTRVGSQIEVNEERFREGRDLVEKTRSNASFLSVCAQFNGEVSRAALSALHSVMFARESRVYATSVRRTSRRLEDDRFRNAALKLLAAADLTIRGLRVEPPELQPNPNERVYRPPGPIKTLHRKYSAENVPIGEVEFDLLENESAGTVRFVSLLAPIVDGLADGRVVVADEMDSRMHPLMTRFLVQLFQGPTNTSGAQLIFATHDVNLLSNKFFRRDQIWFTEKDRAEATHLYSLADHRQSDGELVRKDASFARDYLLGKFGAVPFIGPFMIETPDEQT